MRIAQLAPLVESVPPNGYGGSELVVSLLTEELVKRGHDVTLFASADSVTEARLIPCAPEGLRRASDIPQNRWAAYDLRSLLEVERMQNKFDVIHNHLGCISLPFLRNIDCCNVTTNHNPVADYCASIYLDCGHLPFVAISNSYRQHNYPSSLNYVATIYNGIDLDAFDSKNDGQRDYLLFVGRISQAKGTVEAIRIAKELSIPIVVAGKVDRNDQEYFDSLVRPLLSESGVEYVGEVTMKQKCDLYKGAVATVCPIRFEEPFGLVLAESLASGTPVMALRRGAVAEIVSDSETGIISDTVGELIDRFGEIENMSSIRCKQRVKQLFSKERMTDQYEALYLRLLSK